MTQAHEAHPHPNYIAVFIILIVMTAVSFWTVSPLWPGEWTTESGHTLVMVVAVFKALLVALFFMHLWYDWFKVYMMVVAALILGTIAMIALLPDMVFSETQIKYEIPVVKAAEHAEK